jgi:hypothetical protein
MEKNPFMRKWLVVEIILLFIGVAIAPSINFNIVKACNDNDLVEVTTQACGINGFENTTLKLTREQYQDLELYLIDFRARLNQTTTQEEVVPIFKEAVTELDKYGLLPNGMSVKRAQRLVTSGYQRQNAENIVKRFSQGSLNLCCFFSALIYDPVDYNIWIVIAALLSLLFDAYSPFVLLVYLFFFIGFFKPLRFNNIIAVIGHVIAFFSAGLAGIKTGGDDIDSVIGFTGLKITINYHTSFYLGFAGFIA